VTRSKAAATDRRSVTSHDHGEVAVARAGVHGLLESPSGTPQSGHGPACVRQGDGEGPAEATTRTGDSDGGADGGAVVKVWWCL
jgi:hypothetical protein